ncbi:TonB-dependent receptor domain-containing protein [Paracoccus cavernae]|uniref:TonB-dependent receptor domain-containing protein n=1 Tax=Paracoccus cavernae TaxID=1571207 RepID=UPI00363FC1C1
MFRKSRVVATLWATTAFLMPLHGAVMAQDRAAEAGQTTAPTTTDKAGNGPVMLDPVTIYATRQEASVSDVAASITVVDGGTLEARGQDSLQSMVRYMPGVNVTRTTSATDPFATFSGVTIRGVSGNRVQMMIDGSRVAERITDGTRDYFDFNFIKQVDVVKGPSSVLWGSDALGGVVAFTTIDPEDVLQGQDRAGIGRLAFDSVNDQSSASVAFAQRFSPDLTALIGIARTDGHEIELSNARADGGIYGCPRDTAHGAIACDRLNPADIAANRLLAKLVWEPSDEHKLSFSADLLNRQTDVVQKAQLGATLNSITGLPTGEMVYGYDRALTVKRHHYGIEHLWTPENGFVDEVRTTFSYTPYSTSRRGQKWSRNTSGQEVILNDRLDYSEKFYELDIQAVSRFATGGADHVVTWGFDGDLTKTDYSRLDITRNLTLGTVTEVRAGGFNFANSETRRADLYVQDHITLAEGRLELTPGLRFATYKIDPNPNADYQVVTGYEPRERSDHEVLGSFGAMYHLNDQYTVWANFGQGFKMPTAQQLYTSVPGTFFDQIPAPDLKPEKVDSYELGLRHQGEKSSFGITAFRANYDNFIQSFYNPPNTTVYTYRNLSSVKVWGVELEGPTRSATICA